MSSLITIESDFFGEILESAFKNSFRIPNILIFKDFGTILVFPYAYVGDRHLISSNCSITKYGDHQISLELA